MLKSLSKKIKPSAKASVKAKVVEKPGVVFGYEEEVDRLAEIEAEIRKIPSVKLLMQEKNKLEKYLRDVADGKVLASETATYIGTEYCFHVSAKSMQRTIPSMKEVAKMFGPLFMEVASVSMTDIDKYLTEEQKAKVLIEDRTGARRGELVAKE